MACPRPAAVALSSLYLQQRGCRYYKVLLKYRSYVKDFLYRKVTNKIRFGYTMLAFPFLCIVH